MYIILVTVALHRFEFGKYEFCLFFSSTVWSTLDSLHHFSVFIISVFGKLSSVHLTQFGGKFFCPCLSHASHRFWSQDITSPVTADLMAADVIEIGPNSFYQLSQSSFLF
jgi:hypothetical protein